MNVQHDLGSKALGAMMAQELSLLAILDVSLLLSLIFEERLAVAARKSQVGRVHLRCAHAD